MESWMIVSKRGNVATLTSEPYGTTESERSAAMRAHLNGENRDKAVRCPGMGEVKGVSPNYRRITDSL